MIQPCNKNDISFNIESQQQNEDGLIGGMNIIMVNQSNAMAKF